MLKKSSELINPLKDNINNLITPILYNPHYPHGNIKIPGDRSPERLLGPPMGGPPPLRTGGILGLIATIFGNLFVSKIRNDHREARLLQRPPIVPRPNLAPQIPNAPSLLQEPFPATPVPPGGIPRNMFRPLLPPQEISPERNFIIPETPIIPSPARIDPLIFPNPELPEREPLPIPLTPSRPSPMPVDPIPQRIFPETPVPAPLPETPQIPLPTPIIPFPASPAPTVTPVPAPFTESPTPSLSPIPAPLPEAPAPSITPVPAPAPPAPTKPELPTPRAEPIRPPPIRIPIPIIPNLRDDWVHRPTVQQPTPRNIPQPNPQGMYNVTPTPRNAPSPLEDDLGSYLPPLPEIIPNIINQEISPQNQNMEIQQSQVNSKSSSGLSIPRPLDYASPLAEAFPRRRY